MNEKLKEMYCKNTEDMELKFSYIQQIIDTYNKPNVFLVLTTYNMLSMLDFSIIKVIKEACYKYRVIPNNTLIFTNIVKLITDRIGDSY